MDKLSSMDRERVAAEGVTRDNFKIFEEELSLDKYGTREMPTVSPLASDKPLQRAYKWFSAAESLANSGAPNLNFGNLVRKGTEHISMVYTTHLSPESPRTEAERNSLERRVSNWKKLVARWEDPEKCAQRKLSLIEFVVQQGGDGDKIRDEISVTCKRRGPTTGRRYFFHSSDGQCYRSSKEVCKKFLGITEFRAPKPMILYPSILQAAPRAAIGSSRGPTDVDVSDAGHVPEMFTKTAEWFRAARKSIQAMDQLDHELLAIFARDAGRFVVRVNALSPSWPQGARGTIRGRLVKWEELHTRWVATEAEIRRCPPKPTLAYQQRVRELAEHAQAAQQRYRATQRKKRTCSQCGTTVPPSFRAFPYCGGCRVPEVRRIDRPRYCSEACQRAHWLAGHAIVCPCMGGVG